MSDKIEFICNLWGGRTQGRSLYDQNGIAPTLLSGMSHGNTVPHIMVKENERTDSSRLQKGGS